jgi:hypothetical protein
MRFLPSSALRLVHQALAAGGRVLPAAPRGPDARGSTQEAPEWVVEGERTGERTLRRRIRTSEVRFRGTANM